MLAGRRCHIGRKRDARAEEFLLGGGGGFLARVRASEIGFPAAQLRRLASRSLLVCPISTRMTEP